MKYFDNDTDYIHDDEMEHIFTNNIERFNFIQYINDKNGYIEMMTDCFIIKIDFDNNDICDPFLSLVREYHLREFEYTTLFFKYLKKQFDDTTKMIILQSTKIPYDVIHHVIYNFIK